MLDTKYKGLFKELCWIKEAIPPPKEYLVYGPVYMKFYNRKNKSKIVEISLVVTWDRSGV